MNPQSLWPIEACFWENLKKKKMNQENCRTSSLNTKYMKVQAKPSTYQFSQGLPRILKTHLSHWIELCLLSHYQRLPENSVIVEQKTKLMGDK